MAGHSVPETTAAVTAKEKGKGKKRKSHWVLVNTGSSSRRSWLGAPHLIILSTVEQEFDRRGDSMSSRDGFTETGHELKRLAFNELWTKNSPQQNLNQNKGGRSRSRRRRRQHLCNGDPREDVGSSRDEANLGKSSKAIAQKKESLLPFQHLLLLSSSSSSSSSFCSFLTSHLPRLPREETGVLQSGKLSVYIDVKKSNSSRRLLVKFPPPPRPGL